MDLVNVIVKYVQDFAATSEATYHINPWIFCVLFFGSAAPLYFGYFLIARSALKYEDHKLKRKKLDKRQLRIGITVSVVAWWVPYIYVIFFGRLPVELWIAFIIIVLAMGIFFFRMLRAKVLKIKLTSQNMKDIEDHTK